MEVVCLCKWKIRDIAERSKVTQQMEGAGVTAA